MTVQLDLPERIVQELEERGVDAARTALEGFAAEAYRSGAITAYEVQTLLGLASRWETDAFLKERQAYLHYSLEDLESDIESLRQAT